MDFQTRLRELRESKGLSQEQLAEFLGIPRSTITHYETSNEGRLPRRERLESIADFFNVSVDYLLGRDEISVKNLIGEKIKRIRERKRITKENLAKKLNNDVNQVNLWEENKDLPSDVDLFKLSKIFNMSVSDLLLDGETFTYKGNIMPEKYQKEFKELSEKIFQIDDEEEVQKLFKYFNSMIDSIKTD